MAANSMSLKRIKNELSDIAKSNCGISVTVRNDNLRELEGKISGPPDTPYEGGEFIVNIKLPKDYPFRPPAVRFVTKIWHPNINSTTGHICLDILGGAWAASMTLRTVLLSLQQLLQDPEQKSPLDHNVAVQYRKSPQLFKNTARYWAQRYANAPGSIKDFDDKVKKLKDMGVNETCAVMALSSYSWVLEKAAAGYHQFQRLMRHFI